MFLRARFFSNRLYSVPYCGVNYSVAHQRHVNLKAAYKSVFGIGINKSVKYSALVPYVKSGCISYFNVGLARLVIRTYVNLCDCFVHLLLDGPWFSFDS